MVKIQRLISAFLLCFICFAATGQHKYALLIGINKYYDKPGIMHHTVLQGCVNDARSMKSMLIHRFAFADSDVITLFDAAATKANAVKALTGILSKSNAGDAVVFYFSGHGVWMSNNDQSPLDQSIKHGMNQAMVMSDLYADNLDCLFTDAAVKKMFDKFVEKKVILTSVFDCCFSGKMPMSVGMSFHNPYSDTYPAEAQEKSLEFGDVYYTWAAARDLTQEGSNNVDINEILAKQLLEDDSTLMDDHTRSFNLRDALFIHESKSVMRPSEMPHSMFLSLAAGNDVEKSLEITDENGIYHGAYTKALLQTIKENPSNIPVSELIKKTEQKMHRQLYDQNPMHFEDPARLNKNFLGIDPVNFNNNIEVKCTVVTGKQVELDAGLDDGLGKANRLAAKGNKNLIIEITGLTADHSIGSVVSGNPAMVKPGDHFIIVNGRTASAPLLKVYIAGTKLTAEEFTGFVNKNALPLTALPGFWDYENWESSVSENILFNDPASIPSALHTLRSSRGGINFLVFLPVPAFITDRLKARLSINNDVQLVGSPKEANLLLYLNYAKGSKNAAPHFVFTWLADTLQQFNEGSHPLSFTRLNVQTPSLQLTNTQTNNLVEQIYNMIYTYMRARSTRWFSD